MTNQQLRLGSIGSSLRKVIENALRAMSHHGAVTVIVEPVPALRVRDKDPPDSRASLANFRQRRHRGDHSSKHGARPGLAIVLRIMQSHDGSSKTNPRKGELVLGFN